MVFHIVTVGVSVTVPTGVALVVVIVRVALVEPDELAVTQVELKPAPVGRPATEPSQGPRCFQPNRTGMCGKGERLIRKKILRRRESGAISLTLPVS